MNTTEYLHFIVREIHTTVVATVDKQGLPVTCAVDMMDSDESSLYFLTAKGKSFYERLKKRGYLSLTGIKGEDTMTRVAVSLRGKVRELDTQNAKALFDKNPYMYEIYPNMYEIYPTEKSRSAIRVFQLYDGNGQWFDLSKKPIERTNFSFGNAKQSQEGYYVTDKCIGCKLCYSKCPQKCIDISVKPVVINQNHCLHCGNCFEICPMRAIVERG